MPGFAPGVMMGVAAHQGSSPLAWKEMGNDEKARVAFNFFDKNRDGYITKNEMASVSQNLSQEQVDLVFKRIDANKDGRLTFDEFQELINRHKNKPDQGQTEKSTETSCCSIL